MKPMREPRYVDGGDDEKTGWYCFSRAKGNRVDSVYDASEVTVWHCELKTGWGVPVVVKGR